MQDKPLPLDVQLLAKRAESRNMFAKCLRYREREFNSLNILPSGECIEALISVNNELGLPDRAAGVLHYVNTHYSHISIEPQWLQKLCHWERARQSYLQQNMKWIESYPDDRPPKHPSWMAGEIGEHALLFLFVPSCSMQLRRRMNQSDYQGRLVLSPRIILNRHCLNMCCIQDLIHPFLRVHKYAVLFFISVSFYLGLHLQPLENLIINLFV